MSQNILRVGLVQHACTSDREANLETSIAGIRDAARLISTWPRPSPVRAANASPLWRGSATW